ncbi:MAG: flagellar protein FlgN [Desulfobacter sp.]
MEKVAYEIEKLLQEKRSCYRQLETLLEREKEAIATIDLESLWQSTRAKKELAEQIEGLREKILSRLEEASLGMDMDPRSFSLAYLVDALPFSNRVKSGLRRIKVEINTAKDRVVQQAEFNKAQVQKHLRAVDDIMSVIGDNSKQSQYTGAGMMPGQKKHNCIFRAEV